MPQLPESIRYVDEPRDDASVRHLAELGYVDPEAVTARERALRRQLEAEFQQAANRYEQGDVEEARALFEKLIVDDPAWVAPRQLLAEIYYRTERLAEAETQLAWLTEHAVEHPRLALISGAIALARREVREAREALEYAAYVELSLPSVHVLLGMARLRLADLAGAEAALLKAVEQNPGDAHALDALAVVGLRRGDFPGAANFALEALTYDMQLFSAHYHLGVALVRLDRPQEAIVAFETATQVNPSSAAPYYWLSQIAGDALGDARLAAQYRGRGREVIRARREARRMSAVTAT